MLILQIFVFWKNFRQIFTQPCSYACILWVSSFSPLHLDIWITHMMIHQLMSFVTFHARNLRNLLENTQSWREEFFGDADRVWVQLVVQIECGYNPHRLRWAILPPTSITRTSAVCQSLSLSQFRLVLTAQHHFGWSLLPILYPFLFKLYVGVSKWTELICMVDSWKQFVRGNISLVPGGSWLLVAVGDIQWILILMIQ